MTGEAEQIPAGAEGERWFASVVESVTDGVLVIDPGGSIRYANPATGLIAGRDAESMVGRDAFFFLHPDDKVVAHERLLTYLDGEPEAGFLQARVQRPDGTVRIVEFVAGRIGDGGAPRLAITARDITRQKQAERQLEESEERFRSLLYHTPQIVYQMDLEGRLTDLNPTAVDIWGEPLENVRGEHFIELIHEEDREDAITGFRRAVEGEPSWYELRIATPVGTIVHLHGVTVPLRVGGEIVGAAGVAEDITAMVASRRELAEAQHRMQHVLSVTPTVLYSLRIHGEDASPSWISDNAAEVFGHPPGAFENLGEWLEHIHPEDRERVLAAQARLRSEGSLEIDYRFRRGDGVYVWVFDSARVVHGPDGRPVEIIGSWTDISARKRHEEALRESEQRLEAILRQMPAMTWAVDSDLRVIFARGKGMEALGIAEDDVVGRALEDVVEGQDSRATAARRHRAALSGEGSSFELRFMGRDMNASLQPMRGPDGGIAGVIGLALDVTERKALEQQLRESQKMEAVGRLTGGVAHDFNNLLTAIRGYAELLLEEPARPEQDRADLEEIRKAAEQAARLTQQLLAFSRREMLQPEELDLNAVVDDMSSMLRRIVGEDIRLEADLAHHLPRVKVDRARFEQVIVNLVVNARDAMPEGGDLCIRTSAVERPPDGPTPNGTCVRVTVSDTGTGIPEESQSHLFEPFFTTKPMGKGTGLGLSTVLGIAQQSGGRIEYETELGSGSAFHVLLPSIGGAPAED